MQTNFFAPGFDDQAEAQTIDRQRKYAEMLRAQALQPTAGQMIGNHYVAPSVTQALARGLNGYLGAKGVRDADARQQALAEAVRSRGAQELGQFAELVGKGPEPGAQPDLRSAYQFAVQAKTPALQQVGLRGLAEMPEIEAKAAERKDERDFRRGEREAVATQRMQDMEAQHNFRMQQLEQQNADRRSMAEEQRAFQRDMRQLSAASGGAAPSFERVQTADGLYAFDKRTGNARIVLNADGKPVLNAAADPTLQGAITGAKESAKADVEKKAVLAKADKRTQQMLSTIAEAEKLLDAGPTQSGIGATVDAIGRVVGASSESSRTAAQLETLSGWLVSNVPRMEGPQSNIDVQDYKIMAGRVGDRTIPVAERKAALKTLLALQQKYADLNRDDSAPASAPAQSGRVVRFDAQGKRLP